MRRKSLSEAISEFEDKIKKAPEGSKKADFQRDFESEADAKAYAKEHGIDKFKVVKHGVRFMIEIPKEANV